VTGILLQSDESLDKFLRLKVLTVVNMNTVFFLDVTPHTLEVKVAGSFIGAYLSNYIASHSTGPLSFKHCDMMAESWNNLTR
jgi:hypothetical protein